MGFWIKKQAWNCSYRPLTMSGTQVFHNTFDEGKVQTLEGSGDDARAQINFPRHGTEWLALSVAKFTPVT